MEGTSWRGGLIIEVAATCLWLIALISSTGGSQLVVGNIEDDGALGRKLTEPPLEFYINSRYWAAEYFKLIRGLRKGLGSEYERHGIPVLANPKQVPLDQRLLLAKLESYKIVHEKEVTLAIDVTTANVVGYEAGSKYYCFSDTCHLPPPIPFKEDTTEKVELGFKTSYTQLEEAAAAKREDIVISRTSLSKAIVSLDASNSSDREKARALILVMQFLCGAARFAYIERKMVIYLAFYGGFKPDAAMIELENNWSRLSTEIQQSYQKAINNPVPMKRADGELFSVDTVSDILKPNLMLLKFNCITGRDRLSSSESSSSSSFTTSNPLRQVITTSEDDHIDDTNVYGGGEDVCPELEPTTRIVGRDGLCVVVQDSDPTDGNKIILDDCDEFNHLWTFKRDSTIRWKDKCLTILMDKKITNQAPQHQQSTSSNNIMVIYNCSTAPQLLNTRWDMTTDGSIVSRAHDGMSLTAPGRQGTPLTAEKTTWSSAQAWLPTNHYQPFRAAITGIYLHMCMTLKEGDDRVPRLERCGDSSKRTWAIYADGTIRPVLALHQCLTLILGTQEEENRVRIEDCIGSYKQRWMFRSNGYLMNPESGLTLDTGLDESYVLIPIPRRPTESRYALIWLPLL
ncbi:hypothetical protein Tsubulata_028476 [Turnera subulata]|uniref:Ribosome-inactivating protein n=1 Tax=Turnera subulata TaxID=218843 RepID=A0A9Q0FQ85_9ROSI|nr:hypothetical protein Tsubulata_028476 [Turnera subulata]